MAQIHGARLKYLRNGLTKMKWLKNLTNGFNMWEMTYIFGNFSLVFDKRLKYVGNDVDLFEMAQKCSKMT